MKMTTKPIKKANAITHGAYAKDTLLPWEDPKEFEDLLQQLLIDMPAHTALQGATVFAIAHVEWKKLRVMTGSQQAYLDNPEEVKALTEAARGAGIAQYIATQRNEPSRFRGELQAANTKQVAALRLLMEKIL